MCWKPPQVPSRGTSSRRADEMAESAPSRSRYGLPGAIHRPSNSTVSWSSCTTAESVGTHSTPTVGSSRTCEIEVAIASWVGLAAWKSPITPIRVDTRPARRSEELGSIDVAELEQRRAGYSLLECGSDRPDLGRIRESGKPVVVVGEDDLARTRVGDVFDDEIDQRPLDRLTVDVGATGRGNDGHVGLEHVDHSRPVAARVLVEQRPLGRLEVEQQGSSVAPRAVTGHATEEVLERTFVQGRCDEPAELRHAGL